MVLGAEKVFFEIELGIRCKAALDHHKGSGLNQC